MQNSVSPCNVKNNDGGIIALPLSALSSAVQFLVLQMLKVQKRGDLHWIKGRSYL